MEFLLLFILIFVAPKAWCPYLSEAIRATYPDCAPFITSSQPPVETSESQNEQTMKETLFEGDILGINRLKDQNKLTNFLRAIEDEPRNWKDAVIVYRISTTFRDKENVRALVKSAIQVFEHNTCVRFREKTTRDKDFVDIIPGIDCSSFMGFQGGVQLLNLDETHCMSSGIIQHLLMHAIGFYHEQSRTDRDNYVDINWNNIAERNRDQFEKYTSARINDFGLPYDFNSIMHYKWNEFAMNPKNWTIRSKSGYEHAASRMGQRQELSKFDIVKINALYHCPKYAYM